MIRLREGKGRMAKGSVVFYCEQFSVHVFNDRERSQDRRREKKRV